MDGNGSVNKNKKYQDICTEMVSIKFAYNNDPNK